MLLPVQIVRHAARVSGPVLDWLGRQIEVPADTLLAATKGSPALWCVSGCRRRAGINASARAQCTTAEPAPQKDCAHCVIAACAIRNDLGVIHVDRDFELLASVSGPSATTGRRRA